MRLIQCDRCGERVEWDLAGPTIHSYPSGWHTISSGHYDKIEYFVFCPVCVERALEKPGTPLVVEFEGEKFTSVPAVPGQPCPTCGAIYVPVDVLESEHADSDSQPD